jgi:hypothetical protein
MRMLELCLGGHLKRAVQAPVVKGLDLVGRLGDAMARMIGHCSLRLPSRPTR